MKTLVGRALIARRGWMTAWAAVALLAWTLSARAQSTEGIVVQGVGTAKGRPSQVEIATTISAEAELASDATVKYRDAKKRAISTMDGLRNPNLSLEFAGFAINSAIDATTQQMIQRGQVVTPPKAKIQVSESCRITLNDIDKMPPDALMDTLLKIVDAAKDAGFQIGTNAATNNYYEQQARAAFGNALVTFKIADSTPLRDQAYKGAFDDAKAKAQKLADMAGVKLGRVLSVQEAPKPGSASSGNSVYDAVIAVIATKSGADEKSLLGSTFSDMAVRVPLTVQFEIVK